MELPTLRPEAKDDATSGSAFTAGVPTTGEEDPSPTRLHAERLPDTTQLFEPAPPLLPEHTEQLSEEMTCTAANGSENGSAEASTAEPAGASQQVFASMASSASAMHGNTLTAACKHESSSMDTAEMCVICYEGYGDRVMLPCGHGGYCQTCARRLFLRSPMLCPICREPLRGVIKVAIDTPIGGEQKFTAGT